jgi:formylglycine-generating enzyme required for sulfatase activity
VSLSSSLLGPLVFVSTLACGPTLLDTAEEDLPTYEELPELITCDTPMEGSGDVVGDVACSGGICTIAGGGAWLGSDLGEPDECPPRVVEISEFSIDQTEVTRGQYAACEESGACSEIPEYCDYWAESITEDADLDDLPVICVDWNQADAYCAWVGGRLPTEAEWEKSARGTEGATWPWGEDSPLCEEANFKFASWYCFEGVVEVGFYSHIMTAYGLFDTTGNAWEWVSDYYDAHYYEDAPLTDPSGPESDCHRTWGGEPGDCEDRVLRGGAYNTTESTTRGSARSNASPDIADVNIGFRCAYD